MSTKERDKNAERQNTFHWQKACCGKDKSTKRQEKTTEEPRMPLSIKMNNHKKLENWYFFAKKASQVVVKIKSELLDRKKETSPTCCNFEIFDHDPQLDMKF